MLIGQDFDCEDGYRHSLARGEEELTVTTWGNLRRTLAAAGIAEAECFFTNAIKDVPRLLCRVAPSV